MKSYKFRNIESGKIMEIKAKDSESAWKKIEKDYSDPLHAYEDWAIMQ